MMGEPAPGLPRLGVHHGRAELAQVPRPVLRQRNLPATFASSVSEWYCWSNDLRRNPDIKILASVDPSSFPLGPDPDQSRYSGYYPILWTNTKYRMLYADFGHNAMDHATDATLSSTFASQAQNRFPLDGPKWLDGTATSHPHARAEPQPHWRSLR